MFIAMRHWAGSRPLVSGISPSLDPHRNSSGSLGDLAGLVPLDQFLYQLQQVLDGVDARASQSKAQLWAWMGAKLVSLGP